MIWEVQSKQDQDRISTELVDDWVNGGYVDVLFACGECGFCSLGSWSYSKEWVKLGTTSMWHCYR